MWRYTLADLHPDDDPETWARDLAAEGWRSPVSACAATPCAGGPGRQPRPPRSRGTSHLPRRIERTGQASRELTFPQVIPALGQPSRMRGGKRDLAGGLWTTGEGGAWLWTHVHAYTNIPQWAL